jgi:hypothetical protein
MCEEKIKQYLIEKVDVIIQYTNETGEWRYAIVVFDDPEFWLDSFITEKMAITFCNKHGLKIIV